MRESAGWTMYTAKRGYRPGDEPVAGYHLTKFLGKGQFGEVWQAKAPGGMQVALKLIDLGEREGLKEFSGLLQVKDIRHANLVEFVACWVKTESGQVLDELPTDPVAALSPRDSSIEIGGTMLFDASGATPTRPVELIVAMSLGSKTLYRRLQEVNPGKEQKDWVGMPEDELLDYMEQAARGIDYLNQRGIIHGDIKPQNLLIVGDSVKVCDFGLARAVTNLRMTQSGMGTVAYAAPELFEGKPHIQSDQYCLAVSYIELRTGSLPFEEPNPYKVIELHRNGRLDYRKLSRGEQGVVRRATAIRPDRRWPSCTEMVRRLREARHREQTGAAGGWFSFLRSKPDLAVTQQFMPVEEPAVEEPAGEPPGADVAAKKDSGREEPGKKDSGKKKSGPQSPAAARAVQTARRRGDDTDAIAATVASEDLGEAPRRGRPSLVGRAAKLGVWLVMAGALAFGGYKFATSDLGKRTREDPGKAGPVPVQRPTRESVKEAFLACVARGEFEEAADIVAKAEESLSAADHKKLCAEIHKEWGEPSANPILQQLQSDAIRPGEAARSLENAETAAGFKKLVDGVPEALWRPVREKWTSAFDAVLASGNLEKAVEECSSAPSKLVPLAERERLRARIAEPWSKRFDDLVAKGDLLGALPELEGSLAKAILDPAELGRKRALVRVAWNRQFQELLGSTEPGATAKAFDELKKAKGNIVPEEEFSQGVEKVRESWSKGFDALVSKGDWDAADQLAANVPVGLFSPSDLDKKREAVREQRRQKWIAEFDAAVLKGDWSAADQLASGVPAGLFSPEELDKKLGAIADHRRQTWNAAFDALVAKGQWGAAKEKLDRVPTGLFLQTDLDKKLAQIQTPWNAAFEALVAKSDWPGAKKLLDGVPPTLFPQPEFDKKLAQVQTAWNSAFEALAKSDLPAAEQMTASLPPGLFLPSEIDQKRALVRQRRQQKWDEGFNALVVKGSWDAAKKVLDGAPEGLFTEPELQDRRGQLRASWITKEVNPLIEKKDWDAAEKSLDHALVKLFPKSAEVEKLKEVIESGRRGKEMDALDKSISDLLDANKFAEAKQKLDEAVARKKLPQERAGEWEKKLRQGWYTWIRGNWDKSDQAEGFRSQVSGFLKASPEPVEANEAKLLRARLLVRLGQQTKSEQDLKDARDDLQVLEKAADLPADQSYLRDVLQVIAKLKPREKLAKGPEKPAAPWGLTPWENEELARIPLPPPPPPPPPPAGQMAVSAIRKALGSARELLPLVEQRFPTAKADGWTVTDSNDVKLVTREVPSGLGRLAVVPAYPEQAKDLTSAAAWLQAARVKFPGYAEISSAFRVVLERRIALRVTESQGPSQDDWGLLDQWEEARKDRSGGPASTGDELLVRAWRVECMLALGKEAASARDHLVPIREELLKAQPAYGHYLWCRALRAVPEPGWDEIVGELNDLLPALEGPAPILKAQDRAGAVVGLIVEAAQKRRAQARPWKTLDRIPFNPFAGPAEAEQYAKLLKAARKFPGAGENRELKLSLLLAASHEAKPESDLAWSLARELLPLRDASVQADLLPLLFAGVTSFWQQPQLAKLPADDPQCATAIRATTQLLQDLSKDEAGKITKEGAAAVYQSVLQPVLESPGLQAAAKTKGPSELMSHLSGAAAKFLDSQKDAEWPFPKTVRSIYHVIESQATLAIDLYPKGKADPAGLVEYYALRAAARAYKSDFHAAEVLADADAALKIQPKLHTALGIRAYALFMRAQEQPKRDQILKDLADSIISGDAAMKNCLKGNKQFPGYMLNLANAHLWLGNYETDAEKKQQHFDLARKLAGDAAKLEHDYGDEARLLLGNIYEDLASQVGENPKQNYLEAKKRFSQVLERNPLSAQALCSLARCHYKALVQTRLSPQDFGFRDRDAVLKRCKDDLEKAVGFSVQDSIRIESYRYLGEVFAEQGDWTKADENLGKAADLAKELGAPSRAAYVFGWAMLPITHADRLLSARTRQADDPEILQLLKTAEQRADVLQATPAGQFVIPAKQVARIKGLSFGLKKDFDQAVQAYDRGLPRDLARADASDVGLLLGRAACHLALCKLDENGKLDAAGSEHAKAVLRDASRALEVAPDSGEQADAQYCLAQAHVFLMLAGDAVAEHREEFLNSMREAMRLAPQGVNGVKYRLVGGRLVTSLASGIAKSNREEADKLWKEARGWLEQALELEQDAKKKKDILQSLEVNKKLSAPPAE